MTQPTISVVIAAYNASATIEKSIESALSQQDVQIDVIVVDDHSTDDTRAKAAAFDDRRIHLIALERNCGPGAARNRGIAAARGDFIAVLDADDYMGPSRLRRLFDVAEIEQADVVADNLIVVENGVEGGTPFRLDLYESMTTVTLTRYLDENLIFSKTKSLGYLKPMFRKAFLRDHGLEYDESLWIGEDFLLVAEALVRGARFVVAPYADYFYTISRTGSVSNRFREAHAVDLLTAARKFRRDHGARMSAGEHAAERKRMASIHEALQFVRAVSALKARKIGDTARILSRTPRAALLFRMPVATRFRRMIASLRV